MKDTNFKGAIFDLDGTLVDSLMVWEVLWDKFGRKFLNGEKFQITADDDKAVRTKTLKDAMYFLHSIYNIGNSGEELLETANELIREFYACDVKLKDGVLEFLKYCSVNGVKMCIASATDKNLINVALNHCKISEYFDYILSCTEVGKGKDEPDIYLKAMSSLGTKPEETYIFEDSLVAVQTANKLGIKTVGIFDKYNYGHSELKKVASVYIDDKETLLKLLEAN